MAPRQLQRRFDVRYRLSRSQVQVCSWPNHLTSSHPKQFDVNNSSLVLPDFDIINNNVTLRIYPPEILHSWNFTQPQLHPLKISPT